MLVRLPLGFGAQPKMCHRRMHIAWLYPATCEIEHLSNARGSVNVTAAILHHRVASAASRAIIQKTGAEVQLAVCLVCAMSIAQRVAAQDNALVTHASLLQFQVVGIVLRHPRFSPLEPLGLLGRTCDGRTRQLQPGQLVLRQDLGELVQGACD